MMCWVLIVDVILIEKIFWGAGGSFLGGIFYVDFCTRPTGVAELADLCQNSQICQLTDLADF